jgi:hypothetical protein
MKASEFSGLQDFKNLYSDDHPDLPSIKTALLLGFSDQNFRGFCDRVENQVAIVQSLKSSLAQSQNKAKINDIPSSVYVDLNRIDELRSMTSQRFDLSKLIELCQELNKCYANKCFLAVAMLTRAVLDHVPPIFGHERFSQVANNYSGGGKSFKECMIHLENSSRKIADAHLHGQMREKETLPNRTQVNFSSDLDVLLAEIVRVLMPWIPTTQQVGSPTLLTLFICQVRRAPDVRGCQVTPAKAGKTWQNKKG